MTLCYSSHPFNLIRKLFDNLNEIITKTLFQCGNMPTQILCRPCHTAHSNPTDPINAVYNFWTHNRFKHNLALLIDLFILYRYIWNTNSDCGCRFRFDLVSFGFGLSLSSQWSYDARTIYSIGHGWQWQNICSQYGNPWSDGIDLSGSKMSTSQIWHICQIKS